MVGFILGCFLGGIVVFVLMYCVLMRAIKEYEALLTMLDEDAMCWEENFKNLLVLCEKMEATNTRSSLKNEGEK